MPVGYTCALCGLVQEDDWSSVFRLPTVAESSRLSAWMAVIRRSNPSFDSDHSKAKFGVCRKHFAGLRPSRDPKSENYAPTRYVMAKNRHEVEGTEQQNGQGQGQVTATASTALDYRPLAAHRDSRKRTAEALLSSVECSSCQVGTADSTIVFQADGSTVFNCEQCARNKDVTGLNSRQSSTSHTVSSADTPVVVSSSRLKLQSFQGNATQTVSILCGVCSKSTILSETTDDRLRVCNHCGHPFQTNRRRRKLEVSGRGRGRTNGSRSDANDHVSG